jgi:hypothetical protein
MYKAEECKCGRAAAKYRCIDVTTVTAALSHDSARPAYSATAWRFALPS